MKNNSTMNFGNSIFTNFHLGMKEHLNSSKWVNPEGYCEGVPFWCDKCLGAENEGEEEEGCDRQFLVPICNSPRMGVCGYAGSDRYPDLFEPDKR